MKTQEIRKLKIEDIAKRIEDKAEELQELMFEIKSGQSFDVAGRRNLRKEIAQLNTILREKEMTEGSVEIADEAEEKEVKKPEAKKSKKETKK